jgi:hypothetical protein
MQPSNLPSDAWQTTHLPKGEPVPKKYQGVWTRTLLETPQLRDDTTLVRWMQLSHWHADLRIPAEARSLLPHAKQLDQTQLRTVQQGFCGITRIDHSDAGEACTWHRLQDYQPPEPTPDAGWMVFRDMETVEETGIHGVYREIWQRLSDSTGRLIALAAPAQLAGQANARILIAGNYLMRVQPTGSSIQGLEISFGFLSAGQWHLQHSTWPELEGQLVAFSLKRESESLAVLQINKAQCRCEILEWSE